MGKKVKNNSKKENIPLNSKIYHFYANTVQEIAKIE
jgi:hypothetical protein